ncbi:uncharacterized protein [Anoplolepis gracilipes]|uniref:uncharacterized protein isoform X2 n=1 Tax=Anoplolepis gracilipes TaxID=354296 RepID=UPI003B9F6BE5
MERLIERYYKVNRFILSVIGLWPYQSEWNARLMRIIHFTFLITSVFIQIFSILTTELTMEFITIIIPTVLPTLAFLPQLYIRIKLIDKLKELLERMWNDWALQKTYDEIKIMHEHAETTKLWTLYYVGLSYLGVTIYNIWLFMPEILDIISPMNESRPRIQLPYLHVEFFVDEERYFYFIRFLVCIITFVSPLMPLACSTLFMVLTQHVCAMCELQGYRAERLFSIVKNTKRCDLFRRAKISCEKITVFVRLHNSIIQFIGIINSYYTIPCLMDLIGILFVASITVFQILTIIQIEEALRSVILTILFLSYMFVFNYMGEKVTNQSSNMCEKVYNSVWYNAVVSEQKLLLLIIKRRFQPLVLTAWFYVFSLPNFELILQRLISYSMFIRQI